MGIFNLLQGEFWLIINTINIIIYCHACILVANLGTICTRMLYTKFNQLFHLLHKPSKMFKRNMIISYKLFIHSFIYELRLMAIWNTSFSNALLVFLIINSPLNGSFVVIILKSGINSTVSILLLMFVIQQFICIFGIHILVASLNEIIHQPVKRMIYLFIHDRKIEKKIRLKLIIHNYICAFHTKKRYGVTYGSFGLISMFSFAKVTL